VIPTRDYCLAPSLDNIHRAVSFIHGEHFSILLSLL